MITLTLPFPPSTNTYYRHLSKGPLAGRTLISERGRRYRTDVGVIVACTHVPRTFHGHRLSVELEVRVPDRRKRDLDNLTKGLLDALTHAGIWQDDSQIDDLRIWRSDRMTGEVVVTIKPLTAVQPSLLEAAS